MAVQYTCDICGHSGPEEEFTTINEQLAPADVWDICLVCEKKINEELDRYMDRQREERSKHMITYIDSLHLKKGKKK